MSRRVDPSELYDMLPKTDRIRGISILAHIDHGKTTLSDSLVSSNGVISSKLAGKLRYLDSTEEEQRRGITMHSSAISLLFDMEKPTGNNKNNDCDNKYLINLIDSPGHLDFSSDVSTATRLCDGALIVVDVVEGVCTQTHAVLFKALKERLRPCLILNKIDRLIIDMKLTATEGFYHLRRLIEKVNAVAFTLVNSQIRIYEESLLSNPENTDYLDTEKLLNEWQLTPENGNVIFASAIDCWGFGIGKFAMSWATKLNINKNILQKYLFGDFTLNLDTKKVIKFDPHEDCYNSEKKPMFVALVLDTIWDLYNAAMIDQNPQAAADTAKEKLGIELTPREVNKRDPRSTIQSIFRRWLSLSDAVLRMVVRCMPDPKEAQKLRLSTILDTKYIQKYNTKYQNLAFKMKNNNSNSSGGGGSGGINKITDTAVSYAEIEAKRQRIITRINKVQNSIMNCSSNINEDDVVVFVSKMMPVKLSELSARDCIIVKAQLRAALHAEKTAKTTENRIHNNDNSNANNSEDDQPLVSDSEIVIDELTTEVFMALGRVFSGVLTRDTRLYVLNSRHDPLADETIFTTATTSNSSTSGATISGTSGSSTITSSVCTADTINTNISSSTTTSGGSLICLDEESEVPEQLAVTAKRVPIGSFGLYLPLGPSVIPVEQVAAGNIVGIIGLDQLLLKTATLSSTWACQPLKAMTFQARPIVQVAVEPKNPLDLPKLEHGLMNLYQYDPAVEVGIDDTGQHTVSCLGELHLEQCLKSLSERFAKCEIIVSEPLVPYRESVSLAECETVFSHSLSLPMPWCDTPGLRHITVSGKNRLVIPLGNNSSSSSSSNNNSSSNSSGSNSSGGESGYIAIQFSCLPLPPDIITLIENNTSISTNNNSSNSNSNSNSNQTNCNFAANSTSTSSSNINPVSIVSEIMTKAIWSDTYLSDYVHNVSDETIKNENGVGNMIKFLREYESLVRANGMLPAASGVSDTSETCSYDNAERFKSVYTILGSKDNSNDSGSNSNSGNNNSNSSPMSQILSFGSKSILTNVLVMNSNLKIELYDTSHQQQYNTSSAAAAAAGGHSNNRLLGSFLYFQTSTTSTTITITTSATTTTITTSATTNACKKDIFTSIWTLLQSSIVAGFQECCNAGPIMHEPLHGVCYSIDCIEINLHSCLQLLCGRNYSRHDILRAFGCDYSSRHAITVNTNITATAAAAAAADITTADTTTATTAVVSSIAAVDENTINTINSTGDNTIVDNSLVSSAATVTTAATVAAAAALSSGQLISEVKSTLRLCMLSCPLRIVEPIYACDLQCDQSQLGSLYGVLSKRRGEVNKEDIIDGTSLFILSAVLPVSESFGFSQELLRKTSGSATAPQLIFSHWKIVEENPFWRPKTEEELEEFGNSKAYDRNIFRIRIDQIRKRKGLAIEEKVVINAEKQRNANRKK